MYADPRKIRNNEVKIRFDDLEYELIEALTNYTGEQKAVIVREMALKAIKDALHQSDTFKYA